MLLVTVLHSAALARLSFTSLALGLWACGGASTIDGGAMAADGGTDAAIPDAGTHDAGTHDAGTHDAGTHDAGTHDGGCSPVGTWRLQYTVLDAGQVCSNLTDTLRVQTVDGGLVFGVDSIGPTQELCGPSSRLVEPSVTASFDVASCRLQFLATIAYCYSGEAQCHRRGLDVSLSGDAVTGTGVIGRCWCLTSGETRVPVTVSGARQ